MLLSAQVQWEDISEDALPREAMEEIHALALARGIDLFPQVVDKTMHFLDTMPSEATSSMQGDIMEGRPSELEARSGAVVRLGREAGVQCPVHHFIYSSLLPIEIGARRVEGERI